MDVTIIGSGTVVPHPDRVCSCYYVETRDRRILLDCGPGAVHHLARFGAPWNRVTHVVLSHFHTDHVGDVPLLLFALKHGLAEPRREPLAILGPAGTHRLMRALADAFGDYVRDPGFELRVRELASGDDLALAERLRIRAHATPHTEASLAYRIETPAAALGYTGDTGFSESLGHFFRNVDLLIAECSLPEESSIESHLTPRRVAALAREAKPSRLVLTHVYPQLEGEDLPMLVRQAGWSGDTQVAHDGMRLRLPADPAGQEHPSD